jgi:hypothetical protein
MTANHPALVALMNLAKRAQQGDPRAQMELQKLRAMLAGGVLNRAAEDAADAVIGAHEEAEELRAGDDLEMAAYIAEADVPGADELTRKAALRSNRLGNLNEQAAFTNQNPPSVLAGISGNQAEVAPGELTQVCNWLGDDAHTSTLSLVIAPSQQLITSDGDTVNGYPTNFEARPYARIQFGNKAFAVAALVDIGTGIQLDVSGSMVTIEVGLKAIPAGAVSGTMKLAGMISSYKSIMRTAPLYYTEFSDDATILNQFKVPPFARRVIFEKFDVSKHVTLRALAPSPVSNNKYDFDIPANSQQTVPLPLAGDIQLIQAFDVATDENAAGRFLFELGL